jgi:hypothetical protein
MLDLAATLPARRQDFFCSKLFLSLGRHAAWLRFINHINTLIGVGRVWGNQKCAEHRGGLLLRK